MSQGEVVKSGYLTKSPPEGRAAIAQWHRRWFVFSDSLLVYPLAKRYVRMEYYQSEEDAKKLKDPKGRRCVNVQYSLLCPQPLGITPCHVMLGDKPWYVLW